MTHSSDLTYEFRKRRRLTAEDAKDAKEVYIEIEMSCSREDEAPNDVSWAEC